MSEGIKITFVFLTLSRIDYAKRKENHVFTNLKNKHDASPLSSGDGENMTP
jgi:hypothetical protein